MPAETWHNIDLSIKDLIWKPNDFDPLELQNLKIRSVRSVTSISKISVKFFTLNIDLKSSY